MKEKKCKHCGQRVTSNHSCNAAGRFVYYDNDDDFLLSFVAGAVTGDPAIGFLAGKNIAGSMLGASLSSDDEKKSSTGDVYSSSHSSSHDTSSHSDPSPDSGGSDSGGGGD